MCGISGIYQFSGTGILEKLEVFNNSLRHRGPDFQDTYYSPNGKFGMGHCRLSIVDLSENANQPFSKYNHRYWLSFNGEIYNFIELQKELESLGEHFVTHSDTEVVITAYKRWGPDCLTKFNGMWAFAIWDEVSQELFIARDRFGVKPIYYAHKSDYFTFASEQKAFKHLETGVGLIEPSMASAAMFNPPAIESQRETIYRDIHKLLPGEYLTVSANNALQIHRWWETYSELNIRHNQQTGSEDLLHLFEDACAIRTRTDVKLAASLSGGLDSSAVTCMLGGIPSIKDKGFKAFIGSFKDTELDEYKWAKMAVDSRHIQSERIEIGQEQASLYIQESAISVEEISFLPAIGQSTIYAEMKKQGYKVSLEGHGGDELFGGYPSHINAYLGQLISEKGDPIALAKTITCLGNSMQHFSDPALDLKGSILQSVSDVTRIKHRTNHLAKYLVSPKELKSEFLTVSDDEQFNSEGLLFQKLYYDFHFYTLPNILRNYDRLSMANSVEVRSPMLDYRFVVAAFCAKESQKIQDGSGKTFLRNGCQFIPEPIRSRKDKLGFSPPIAQWFSSVLKDWLNERISDSTFKSSNVFDGDQLQKDLQHLMSKEHFGGVARYWPLISLHLLDVGGS